MNCNICNIRFRNKRPYINHCNNLHKLPENYQHFIELFCDFMKTNKSFKDSSNKFNIYYYSDNSKHSRDLKLFFEQFKNLSFINILEFENYQPNENDILFLHDTMIRTDIDDVISRIKNFKKNRYFYIYENPTHPCINYRYNKIYPYVDKIFCSIISPKSIWVPTHHTLNKYSDTEDTYSFIINDISFEEKKKMICSNPIGSGTGYNIRRPILEYFSKNTNIDIYTNYKKYFDLKGSKTLEKNRKTNNLTELSKLKVDIFKDYKFILVLENSFNFGSVTEKLIDSLLSLSVPIYYGSNFMKNIFPDLFSNGVIDASSYNLNELIELIKSMTKEEYLSRVKTIKKHRLKYLHYLSSDSEMRFMCHIMTKS